MQGMNQLKKSDRPTPCGPAGDPKKPGTDFFRFFLSCGLICLFRCGSLVPVVVAWLARKRLLSIVNCCHFPGILG